LRREPLGDIPRPAQIGRILAATHGVTREWHARFPHQIRHQHAVNPLSFDPDPRHLGVEPDPPAAFFDLLFECVPHHPRSALRVIELVDESLDRVLGPDEHAEQHRLQRKVFDPLRRPFGFELRARNAPDLLGVRFEEYPEQTPAEPIRHPLFESILAGAGTNPPTEIAERDENALP